MIGDQFRRGDGVQYVQLTSAAGSVVVTFSHDGQKTRLGGTWSRVASGEPKEMLESAGFGDSPWNRLGFAANRSMIEGPVRGMLVNIALPHWMMFLLAIPSAVKWVRRRVRRPPPAPDETWECPTCGQMFARVPPECPVCHEQLEVDTVQA
jgi:hypothetical protein